MKRFVALALSVALIAFSALSVLAAETFGFVDGTLFTISSDASGDGWQWDADTYTLFLNGYDGDRVELTTGLSSADDQEITLNLAGANRVLNTEIENSFAEHDNDAIHVDAALVICGEGTLIVTNNGGSEDDAISAWYEDDDDSSTITVTDATVIFDDVNYGFYTQHITFTDVTFEVETNAYYAIDAEGDFSATGSTFSFTDAEYAIGIGNRCSMDSCELTFANSEGITSSKYTGGFELWNYNETDEVLLSIANSSIVLEDICDFAYTAWMDDGDVLASALFENTTIKGTCSGYFLSSFHDLTMEDCVVDVEVCAAEEFTQTGFAYIDTLCLRHSDVSLSSPGKTIENVGLFALENSIVDFNNTNSDGFGFEEYDFQYTHPDTWDLYIDGVLSETYGVDDEDIEFGAFGLKILCTHDNWEEEWESDGAKTHTAQCPDCITKKTEAHTFGDGVVTKAATADEEGVLTYTCTKCGETKTEAIPKADVAPATGDSATLVMLGALAALGILASGFALTGKKKAHK